MFYKDKIPTHDGLTDPFLPLRSRKGRGSGKAASALAFAAMTMLTAAHSLADTRLEIQEAVEHHLGAMLEAQAARQGWQGMQLRYEVNVPAAATDLPACSTGIQVQATGEAPSAMERQTLQVRCADTPGWTLNATGLAHVFLPSVHAAGVIDRGQTFTAQDLKLQRINIAKARRGYYNRLEEVVGLAAKRRIRAGQLITPALLEQAMAVRRGQPVRIVANHDGIEASTSGEALADGQPGDVIRVRNIGSGKVIDAKVLDAGVVTSTF